MARAVHVSFPFWTTCFEGFFFLGIYLTPPLEIQTTSSNFQFKSKVTSPFFCLLDLLSLLTVVADSVLYHQIISGNQAGLPHLLRQFRINKQTTNMALQPTLSTLLALTLAFRAIAMPTSTPNLQLQERQAPFILMGNCTVSTNTCLAPYPWGGNPGTWACGTYSNGLGTTYHTPEKYCTVDGHVRLLLFHSSLDLMVLREVKYMHKQNAKSLTLKPRFSPGLQGYLEPLCGFHRLQLYCGWLLLSVIRVTKFGAEGGWVTSGLTAQWLADSNLKAYFFLGLCLVWNEFQLNIPMPSFPSPSAVPTCIESRPLIEIVAMRYMCYISTMDCTGQPFHFDRIIATRHGGTA